MRYWVIYIALICLFGLSSCKRVTLSLDKVPGNTPKGAKIFVSGSFNNWNPGDPNYLMEYNEETKQYVVDLPMGFGNIDYKFTRGDWTTVETDACGGETIDRKLTYSAGDYHIDSIMGWQDLEPVNCERVTVIIDRLPPNTPVGAKIFLAGTINAWQCDNKRYVFNVMPSGLLMLTVPRNSDKLVFKITRGTWESAELNEAGNEQLQREIVFGQKDTVHLAVRSWADMPLERIYKKIIVLASLPKNTDPKAEFFLASNLNNWNPLDAKAKFSLLPDGRRFIKVSFAAGETFMYKVTKGGWETVETDKHFQEIDNRELPKDGKDTVLINIETWVDQAPEAIRAQRNRAEIIEIRGPEIPKNAVKVISPPVKVSTPPIDYDKRKKVFIIIDKLPEFGKNNTMYLAGDFNDWSEKDDHYQFRNLPNGKKYILLRLSDNEQHEFKITRGSWDREEAAADGNKSTNRVIVKKANDDTIHVNIQRWFDQTDQKQLVMVLTGIPENTPAGEVPYLTGDFNNWEAKDEEYKFKRSSDGRYTLTITDFSKRYGLYKITRGSWETEATTKTGRIPGNQLFKINGADSLRVRIERWKDL